MKKIAIIALSSLAYMPYLRCYEEILREAGISFDIFYWDRFGLEETKDDAIAYRRNGTAAGLSLLPAYYGYRRFLLRHLKSVPYESYIVLGTQMGVLLGDFLMKCRFILDIRDYSHEGLLPYRWALQKLIKQANLVCISSRGFLQWLPTDVDYTLSHNLASSDLEKKASPFDKNSKVLSYIGAVGYYDANVKFINGLKNHRFIELRYIGRGTHDKELKEYCQANNIKNVSFYGHFSPEQKRMFYHEANFVIGCYGSDSPVVVTLTPNRLYEACLYRRPIIVNDGIYLADVVREYGLGIVFDLNSMEGLEESMMRYYEPRYFDEFSKRCEIYLDKVKDDILLFKKNVLSALT